MTEISGDNDTDVLIAGAGPTGLALAIWLVRLGVRVRIIDKASEPPKTSRAIGVQARTLEFYRQIGIAGPVVERSVKVSGVNMWVGGRRVARVSLDIGQRMTPYPSTHVYPQDEHERMLIEHLRGLGVAVERPVELVALDRRPLDRVHATLRSPGGSDETCQVSFVAGCDGAHSTVREALGIGYPGGTYSRLFYIADVEAGGRHVGEDVHVDLDESDLLAIFPLHGAGRARLVGTFHEEPGKAGHDATFEGVGERAIRQMNLSISAVNWFSTYRVHHRVARSFRKGRVFLLGDAAHVHSPVGAQGMNTGIGDAVNLAWKLAAVVKGEADERLLDTYEPERMSFARRLVATTDRLFTVAIKEGWLAQRVRTNVVPKVVPSLFRVPAIRHFFFLTLSQIGIRYRHSALSTGAAGSVRGGDRLPWVGTGPHEDNFRPLTSLAWQVHVYGGPAPSLEKAGRGLGLATHVFDWRPAMQRAGVKRGALYVVRPDGYVALAVENGDVGALAHYFSQQGIRPGGGTVRKH